MKSFLLESVLHLGGVKFFFFNRIFENLIEIVKEIFEVFRCKKDGFWIVKKDIGKALFRRGREQALRHEKNES